MDETKGRDIFLGVIGVLTLIVAIVGATFAYFSTQVNSASESVNLTSYQFATSLTFQEVYPANSEHKALIPLASTEVGGAEDTTYLDKALSEGCVDKDGYQVCAVYEASLTNDADDVTLTPTFDVTANGFISDAGTSNVYALLATANGVESTPTAFNYNRANATNVVAAVNGLTYNGASTITIPSGQTVKYYLIVWLENLDESQSDMNKTLKGQITFSSDSGSKLQGTFDFD